MSSKEMSNVGELVHKLLLKNPRYRDSDRQLCCKVWSIEMGVDLNSITAFDLLCEYALPNERSRLTSAESITRARRKLQQEYPNLRGENYKGRHEEVQAVQSYLGYS